jgi:hypothetical protein
MFLLINNFINTEYFTNLENKLQSKIHSNLQSNIIFLSAIETYDLLKSNTKYYDTFYENDFKVRNVKNINEYIKKIENSVTDFTEKEMLLLANAAIKADDIIKTINYNYFDGNKAAKIIWKFGLTRGRDYEEGLPHTIKDTIMLNRNDNININILVRILIHEKVHIYQKMYPDDYKLYLKEKKFEVIKKRESSDNIRANPDIDMYIYKKNGKIYSTTYKNNPTSITDTNQNNQYYEHPCETMAIELSE